MNEEGWYIDPFGHHEARWFSDGTPTALVRDGHIEGQDEAPKTPITGDPLRVSEPAPSDRNDLIRADDAESEGFDASALTERASEAIDRIAGF